MSRPPHYELERVEGDAVVGCDGGILLFYSMNAVQNSLAVVNGVELGSTKEILKDRIKCNYSMCLPSNEPVTHIFEVEATSHHTRLLVGQIDGNITLLDYAN